MKKGERVLQETEIEKTRVEMTQIVLPPDTNNHGTAFGGKIAAWVDICAAVSAQRFCRAAVVTASMDALHFVEPVRLGMIVILRSQVNRVWNSSMEVGVRVDTENPKTGEIRHCCSAYLTFVSIDEEGKPIGLPRLRISTEEEKQRWENAQFRRDLRLKIRQMRKEKYAEED